MSDDNNERKENSWVPSAEQQAIEDWQMFLIGRALEAQHDHRVKHAAVGTRSDFTAAMSAASTHRDRALIRKGFVERTAVSLRVSMS